VDTIDNGMSALDKTEGTLSDQELDAVTGGGIPIITAAALWFICTNNLRETAVPTEQD
jgi:hypothetical protein